MGESVLVDCDLVELVCAPTFMAGGLDVVHPHAALRTDSPAVSRSFGDGRG
jgi:hypothetical protein